MTVKRMVSGKMVNDTFHRIYHEQFKFQKKVEGVTPDDNPLKFQYHMHAMIEELGEVLKADKRWKTHRNDTFNPEEKLDELSDCFITLMNVAIWSGFGSLDLEDAIEKKITINNQRLEKRYLKGETR